MFHLVSLLWWYFPTSIIFCTSFLQIQKLNFEEKINCAKNWFGLNTHTLIPRTKSGIGKKAKTKKSQGAQNDVRFSACTTVCASQIIDQLILNRERRKKLKEKSARNYDVTWFSCLEPGLSLNRCKNVSLWLSFASNTFEERNYKISNRQD